MKNKADNSKEDLENLYWRSGNEGYGVIYTHHSPEGMINFSKTQRRKRK
ncbi:MAG: hypothetical protein ISS95_00700 [Candidatus Aenigmarchaeota archaeon]|nr:hypothetical protein [Candidatus Aenigmarchaeota archaeon]